MLMLIGMIIMMLAGLLLSLTSILSKKNFLSREKMSSFECGFEPSLSCPQPFSIRFFFILLMFLIFDVEIIIILPMISSLNKMIFMNLSIILITFMIILILGILLEFKLGTFMWC